MDYNVKLLEHLDGAASLRRTFPEHLYFNSRIGSLGLGQGYCKALCKTLTTSSSDDALIAVRSTRGGVVGHGTTIQQLTR